MLTRRTPVDLVLVDLMQDRDLAAVKAELAADPIQGFGISHVVRCAAGHKVTFKVQ